MQEQDDVTIDALTDAQMFQAICPARYQVRKMIGQGGMGMVFQALDTELNREVAIKVLLHEGACDPEEQERFLREAKALGFLEHPNIVQIFSSGLLEKGNPYHVMEYLDGGSLSDELKSGPLTATRFHELVTQVLAGLAYAHSQKVVHRDLKPSNIMISKMPDGSSLVKIIDFGIARIEMTKERTALTITRTDAILGSPMYISPEQCRSEKCTHLADLYSLGCILYECVSGRLPIIGDTSFDTMYRHMTEKPEPLDTKNKSASSKQLADLISQCLEKKPEARPQSADEIATALEQIYAAGAEPLDIFTGERLPVKEKARTWIIPLVIGVLVLVAVLTPLTMSYLKEREKTVEVLNVLSQGKQEKIASEIERLKKKIGENAPKTPNLAHSRYLTDLTALIRTQLRSAKEQDVIDAEATSEELAKVARAAGDILKDRLILAHVLKAKSQWKQKKYDASQANFEEAKRILANSKLDKDILIDILLEESLLQIHLHKFDEALRIYFIVVKTYEQGGDRVLRVLSAMDRINQKLDKQGDNRSVLTQAIGTELKKMRPENRAQAEALCRCTNRVALSLYSINFEADAKELLSFSKAWQKQFPGNVKLQDDTAALSAKFGMK